MSPATRVRLAALAAVVWPALGLVPAASPAAPAGEGAVVVIGGAGSPPAALTADEVASAYRRQRQFVGATRLQPVNLPAAHPLRRWFSQHVLGQSPEDMEGYWRDQYFNGVNPPFVLASEEAVIRFVASTPGAVGYVSGCLADRRVRVLLQLDGGPACPR